MLLPVSTSQIFVSWILLHLSGLTCFFLLFRSATSPVPILPHPALFPVEEDSHPALTLLLSHLETPTATAPVPRKTQPSPAAQPLPSLNIFLYYICAIICLNEPPVLAFHLLRALTKQTHEQTGLKVL